MEGLFAKTSLRWFDRVRYICCDIICRFWLTVRVPDAQSAAWMRRASLCRDYAVLVRPGRVQGCRRAGGGSGGYLLFWQGDGEQTMHQVKLPNTTFDLDVHPDQRQLATVHHDQRVRISTL